MAALVSTDVSLSLSRERLGRLWRSYGTATFGGASKSYPAGGIPFPAAGKFGFSKEIEDIQFIDDSSGLLWKYDKTNHTLKAFHRAPVVVFEEVVTLTDNLTGTTKYPMAWPLYASNANQALGLLPVGLTPVANTIAINMRSATPGTRATITARAADSFSTITISYITQAWKEVFDNLVEGEVMAAGATTTNGITFTPGTPDVISFLTAAPWLCGLMVGLTLSTTVSCPKPLAKGQTAAAAEYALDWTNTSPAATTMGILASQAWDAATASIKFNYIKRPTSGFLYDRFTEEDAITSSSQIATFAGGNVSQPLLWSTPGFMPSVTLSSTSATWPIGGIGMTLGTTAQWQPTNWYPYKKAVSVATFTSGTGALVNLAVKPSYLWGVPEDIPGIVPLEMPNGETVLSNTLRFIAWGK